MDRNRWFESDPILVVARNGQGSRPALVQISVWHLERQTSRMKDTPIRSLKTFHHTILYILYEGLDDNFIQVSTYFSIICSLLLVEICSSGETFNPFFLTYSSALYVKYFVFFSKWSSCKFVVIRQTTLSEYLTPNDISSCADFSVILSAYDFI